MAVLSGPKKFCSSIRGLGGSVGGQYTGTEFDSRRLDLFHTVDTLTSSR